MHSIVAFTQLLRGFLASLLLVLLPGELLASMPAAWGQVEHKCNQALALPWVGRSQAASAGFSSLALHHSFHAEGGWPTYCTQVGWWSFAGCHRVGCQRSPARVWPCSAAASFQVVGLISGLHIADLSVVYS